MKISDLALLLLLLTSLILVANPVRADEPICAAIYACNSDGSVMAPFSEGPCAEHYRQQCLSSRLDSESNLAACESRADESFEQIQKLRQSNRRLRLKLRKSVQTN